METDKRENELSTKNQNLERVKEIISKIRAMIAHIQEKCKKFNEELEKVKNALLVHYHKLLAEGRDTR